MPIAPLTPSPVPGQPASPAPAPSARQLKRAEAVLTRAGFHPGAIDGHVTPAFTQALAAFQAAWGLPATGTLDAKTSTRLEHVATRLRNHAKKDEFVSVGQRSGGIRVLEQRLTKLGYDVGKVDGTYSLETAAAAQAFRADQRELQDGISGLGKAAKAVLAHEVAALAHAPERRRVAPTHAQRVLDARTDKAVAHGPVHEGMRGAAVTDIQRHLVAAGFSPKRTSGRFDERTAAAVKAFQAKSNLAATGEVDAKTWRKLKTSLILSKSAAAPAQALGERSRAVLASEKLLQRLGYRAVKADGLFDARTRSAVKAFEAKHHLKRDGVITTGELKLMTKAAQRDYRSRALDTARRFLGFHERGANGNPFSSYFGRPPEAWCADFVSYCYTKAGKPLNECSTPNLLGRLRSNGTYTRSHPKAGDIIMFDWHPGSGPSAEHTGLVEKVFRRNGQLYVQTIEGNSSDSVRRNVWPVNSSVVAGFGTIR